MFARRAPAVSVAPPRAVAICLPVRFPNVMR
jgi:hypothetical protein